MADTVLTILIENTTSHQTLVAEHGLSILVEHRGQRVLLDTGASPRYIENAQTLGVSLDGLDAIVLSHGHYDHTGGLLDYLSTNTNPPPIYAHPALCAPHYAVRKGGGVNIGPPFSCEHLAQCGVEFHETPDWGVVGDGVFVTGQVDRVTGYEDTGGPFYHDDAGRQPDALSDDMGLVIDFGERLWVIAGCAHSGIINILKVVGGRLPERKIDLVAGGFHLVNADSARIGRTIAALREFGVRRVAAGHCTGPQALAALAAEYRGDFIRLEAGLTITN